jgi:hypothetical protein
MPPFHRGEGRIVRGEQECRVLFTPAVPAFLNLDGGPDESLNIDPPTRVQIPIPQFKIGSARQLLVFHLGQLSWIAPRSSGRCSVRLLGNTNMN